MAKVLITGGSGFIGSNLAASLVSKGHSVRVLDNLSEQIHGADPDSSPLYTSIKGIVDFVRADIRDRKHLTLALDGMEVVVHLAAETGTGQSMYAIEKYVDVNVGGTGLLLDIIANGNGKAKKIVVASSRAIYGEGKYNCPTHGIQFPGSRVPSRMEQGDFELHCPICDSVCTSLPTDEESALSPASVYGVTKLTQEQLTLNVASALGIPACALRYQNVYGPGQSLSNPYTGILSIFSTRMLNGNGINIFEDGTESRDFVYIDDVVSATVAAIETDFCGTMSLNVGSGSATDVLTIANLLKKHLKIEVPIEISGKFRVGDIRHNRADLRRIEKLLNFKPSMGINEGLKTFTEWVQSQQITEDGYEKSIEELKSKGLYK